MGFWLFGFCTSHFKHEGGGLIPVLIYSLCLDQRSSSPNWFCCLQVNHLSKRHPEMRIDEVPELTLPIIKPNRDYFCQYCDKVSYALWLCVCVVSQDTLTSVCLQVYKSASKRKAHILKNHPGAELPPSIRKLRPAAPGEPDPMLSTHTQLTGTIATSPVCCPHCAKQYSSKVRRAPSALSAKNRVKSSNTFNPLYTNVFIGIISFRNVDIYKWNVLWKM